MCLATTLKTENMGNALILCNTFSAEFYSIAHNQEMFLVAAAEE